jgi:predicted membrane protein
MKIAIQLVLLVAALVIAYFIYDGVQQKIEFKKEAQSRRELVQDRLMDVVKAQKEFKNEKGRYAANFAELFNFLKTDSLTIVKAIGNVPDTLTEVEAVQQGIVVRDTSLVPASTIFPEEYPVDSLDIVPFSKGEKFKMKAGQIEKNKVNVNVFEAYTTLDKVYKGLSTRSESVDLDDRLQVGSMNEPITTGNW